MNNIRKILSIILIIFIILCVFGGAVYLKKEINSIYNSALKHLENGQYEQAISELELIGDFKDATNYLKDAKLHLKYQSADRFFVDGKYDEASEIFYSLGEFLDSQERYKESQYQKALDLFEKSSYREAQLVFSELEDYKESSLYKARCSLLLLEEEQEEIYVHAKLLMQQNKYAEAKDYFSQILEYKDSRSLYTKCERMMYAKTICAGIPYSLAIDTESRVKISYNGGTSLFDFSDWTNLVSIAGAGSVIVALDEEGDVYSAAMPSFPYSIDVSDWGEIIQISAGERFAVGLTSNHTLVSIGRSEDGQRNLSDWSDIVQVATGIC